MLSIFQSQYVQVHHPQYIGATYKEHLYTNLFT